MKSEPLDIFDKTFLINRLIQQAPSGTLIREFFKNAEENAALAPLGDRRIEIYPVEIDGVRKLAFFNTGVGMSAEELRRATDLSASINKEMSLDGNYGIGAKVSGLTVSKAGIRYRSCKSSDVHEVTIGYDEEQKTYVRFIAELPGGTYETVYDVTAVAATEGKSLEYDWTEVVLFGERPDHDTVAEPLGMGKETDRSLIPTTIFRRFARFAKGIEVRIDVSMTKGGGKDETGRTRRLKTLGEILSTLPRHETVPDPSSRVTAIRYIHDPKHENSSHSLSSRANPATASTTFCALVYKNERYDFKTKKAWSSAAPNFGIPFGSRVLTVEIEIADSMALPNQYRDGLTWPQDRSAMTAEDFASCVRDLMPAWVKEIIRSESPEANENLDDLQKDLQRLLDEFRVPTVTQVYSRRSTDQTELHDEGEQTSQRTRLNILEDDEERSGFEEGFREMLGSRRAQKPRVRKAPEGSRPSKSSQALERVPEIQVLTDPEQIADKSLKGRAGRYYKESGTLFVNGLYPVIARMQEELEAEMAGAAEPEKLREVVLRASRRFMAYRVGKATCYAISKKLSEDWSASDLDLATLPESLSIAADDFRQSIQPAKKWVKEQLKLEQVEGVEAA
jgi:hypothetical protein